MCVHACVYSPSPFPAQRPPHPPIHPHSVLIAGQVDSGKSSLASLLASYAVRLGRAPLFVDLDVGQGNIGVPGTQSFRRMIVVCIKKL